MIVTISLLPLCVSFDGLDRAVEDVGTYEKCLLCESIVNCLDYGDGKRKSLVQIFFLHYSHNKTSLRRLLFS